nr:hypothetical protein CFP56_04248 [Quercus suber]
MIGVNVDGAGHPARRDPRLSYPGADVAFCLAQCCFCLRCSSFSFPRNGPIRSMHIQTRPSRSPAESSASKSMATLASEELSVHACNTTRAARSRAVFVHRLRDVCDLATNESYVTVTPAVTQLPHSHPHPAHDVVCVFSLMAHCPTFRFYCTVDGVCPAHCPCSSSQPARCGAACWYQRPDVVSSPTLKRTDRMSRVRTKP